MKLQSNTPDTVTSNMEVAGQFTIKNSSKAFKILSSGLYANKEKAIVRELSCNCVDSHTARDIMWDKGEADPKYIAPKGTPFLVHLPSSIEPYLAIRDYGIGLDHDGVTKLYTTYFESTKQDSNDFIGALGLGSKSPFSYTHNFTVTATFNGYRRVYTAYINEAGIPALLQMAEGPLSDFVGTDEDPNELFNGLEVRIPVMEREDFGTFVSEAEEVFKWFSDKDMPKIVGNSSYNQQTVNYAEQNIIPGCHIFNSGYYGSRGCYAIQGNIAYPVKLPSNIYRSLNDHQRAVLDENIIMEFALGELDIAASREELGYIPLTVDNIKAKVDAIIEGTVDYVKEELAKIECEWTKARRAIDLTNKEITAIAVKKILEDDTDLIKLLVLKKESWGNRMEVKWDFEQLKLSPKSEFFENFSVLKFFEHSYHAKTNLADSKGHVEDNKVYYYVPRNEGSVIRVVYNDTKRGCITRLKNHSGFGSNDLVMLIEKDGVESGLLAESVKSHLETMYYNIPVEIHKASELDEHITAKKSVKSSILELVEKEKGYWNTTTYYTWDKTTIDIEDDTEEVVYLPLSGFCVLNDNDENIHEWTTKYAKTLSELGFLDVDIYGVRKSQIKDVREQSHWVSAHEYFKNKILDALNAHDPELMNYRGISSKVFNLDNCKYLVKHMTDKESKVYKFAEKVVEADKIKLTSGKLKQLKEIAVLYGVIEDADSTDTEVTTVSPASILEDIFKEYEMLDSVSNSYYSLDAEKLLRYINLIDNAKGEANE